MSEYLEPQYRALNESAVAKGLVTMGPMSSFTWNSDPKRLLFVLSRYKFAARMLEGSSNVIEIGCGDGFASRIVKQHVNRLLLTDADPLMVAQARLASCEDYPFETFCHNFADSQLTGIKIAFDGAFLLDVLEHIPKEKEFTFLENIKASLTPAAKIIVGMPSRESQTYASLGSKEGHINCKTKEELSESLNRVFRTVSSFSMNDEVIHTGFNRMSNYLFGVCTC